MQQVFWATIRCVELLIASSLSTSTLREILKKNRYHILNFSSSFKNKVAAKFLALHVVHVLQFLLSPINFLNPKVFPTDKTCFFPPRKSEMFLISESEL